MIKHIPRIYTKNNLNLNQIFYLSNNNVHYIKDVLRMKIGDIIKIFNDTNYIFFAEIKDISKKIIQVIIVKKIFQNIESPLYIHLGQVISKNEKMNYTIQKSTEIGVSAITPLLSQYSNFEKKITNIPQKIKKWKKIAISAAQQCQRNCIPQINDPENILSWSKKNKIESLKILFNPFSKLTINCLPKTAKHIQIIIGPEKGLSVNEINEIIKNGFFSIKIGPRILRTETAALVGLTILQMKFGDLKT